jgi:hypothetical protein
MKQLASAFRRGRGSFRPGRRRRSRNGLRGEGVADRHRDPRHSKARHAETRAVTCLLPLNFVITLPKITSPEPFGVTACGVVGKAGFEPAISRSRTGRDTRLRYFPS